MNRKALAIAFVLMMAVTSLVFIPEDDSEAVPEVNRYTATYSPDIYWYRYDTASFTYNGGTVYDTYYADLTELDKKDAEFESFIHGGPEYLNSPLINGHSYSVYWHSATSNKYADKSFFVKGDCDELYLNGGSYDMKVVKITYLYGGSETVSFVKAREYGNYTTVEYSVKIGETYTFSTSNFNSFWFRTYSTPITVEYEITGKSASADLGSTPVSNVSINNIYAWYKTDVSLSGTYAIDINQIMFVKGSNDEKRFVTEVVNKNVYYSLSGDVVNTYNSLKDGTYSGTFVIYRLCKSVNLHESDSISMVDGSGKVTSFKSIMLERQTEDKIHLFSTAYSQIKIAVGDYDSDKYGLYLMYSGNAIPLRANSVYTIENEAAKTYTLVVDNKNNDTTDLYTTIAISTEGIPEVDSNPDLFAGICIGLCVLVFGIILISGKKPKWSKKKYDARPEKKSKAKEQKQGSVQQAPPEKMSQQPPAAPVEENVSKADAPQNEEAPVQEEEEPKKKGLFRRKSKEE